MGFELGGEIDFPRGHQGNELGADDEEIDIGVGLGGVEGGVDTWGHVDDSLDFVKQLAGLDFVGRHIEVSPNDEGNG